MATLVRSLAGLASQVADLVATRLELFGLEALQARDRLLWRLAVMLAAVFLLMLAVLVATVAFALSVWPTEHRALALGLLALAYAVLGALLLVWLWVHWLRDSDPFSATVAVLHDDARALVAPLAPEATHPGASDGSPDAARAHGETS